MNCSRLVTETISFFNRDVKLRVTVTDFTNLNRADSVQNVGLKKGLHFSNYSDTSERGGTWAFCKLSHRVLLPMLYVVPWGEREGGRSLITSAIPIGTDWIQLFLR